MKKSIKSIIALVLVIISVLSICSTASAAYYANARSLILRSKTSNGKILYYFEKGEQLTYLGTSGNWYKVQNSAGTTGYVKKSLVSTTAYSPNYVDNAFGAYDYQKTNLKIDKFIPVQKALNSWGYPSKFSPKLATDGICGTKSVDAIKKFQNIKMGISKPDGIAGTNTLTELYPWRP